MAIAIVIAAALVVAVTALARWRGADAPARCPEGMIALGPRCCGDGQRLEAGRCIGPPIRCARGLTPSATGCIAAPRRVRIEAGRLRVGPGDWEAEGLVAPREVALAAFDLDAYEVTEARFDECVATGACATLERSSEPGRAAARMTRDEAARFCAWAGGTLPTADQLAFAAAGPAARRYAWGDTGAVCRRAAWGLVEGPCGEGASGPEISGSHPDGATPEGVFDLAGNVAEWTSTPSVDAPVAEVRGGSWADDAAAALRAWSRREVAATSRSREIGVRCAYPARLNEP